VDERGRGFKVRLVGAVANSILQGSLLIDEAEFTRRFPGESGYRMFLLDAPSNSVAKVSATLSRALEDAGLELTPAARRLNEFNAVQNTYLGTFQVLGGLGLLLGSAGLGVVVLRNVLERLVLLAEGASVSAREVEHVIRSEASGPPDAPPLLAAPAAGTVRPYLPAASHDRQQIEQALAQTHGNKSRAAQLLGLTLRQLNYRMKRLAMT